MYKRKRIQDTSRHPFDPTPSTHLEAPPHAICLLASMQFTSGNEVSMNREGGTTLGGGPGVKGMETEGG